MTRYINNLPDLNTTSLTRLYKRGVQEVDAALGADNCTGLTCPQVQFVGKLLARRGVDVDALLVEVLGPE